MTRVTLVAPVLSSAVPDLGRLLVDDPYVVRNQLARTFGEWRAAPPVASAPSLIHEHEAAGAGLLPDRLLTAERTVPAAMAAHGVEQVHVSVGLHGIVAIVAVVEVPDPAALEVVEGELRSVVVDLAAEVREHLLTSSLVERLDTAMIGRYPVDRFLYWHRLLHDSDGAWDALLCNDVDTTLASGSRLRVGDGYSALIGESVEVRDVLRGLVRAQELWLTITTVSQQLLLETARLTQTADLTEGQLTAEQSRATLLADREALRNGVLRDEITYATGTQRAVLRAAAQAWQVELDTTQVAGRLDVLLHVVGRRLAEQQAQRQGRLNAVVLALTVVGALALLLGLFETGVGDGVGSLDAVRVAVSLAVAAAAVASLLVAFRSGRRSASRD